MDPGIDHQVNRFRQGHILKVFTDTFGPAGIAMYKYRHIRAKLQAQALQLAFRQPGAP